MKLSPQLAQSIVDSMMKQIPYNINIMNENGYIIASGDSKRINTLHVGAINAIQQGKTLPMRREYGSHGQPGVNMPIKYQGQIIGVVGITGNPRQVVPLASLLKTAVELLVRQSDLDRQRSNAEQKQQRFLYQLFEATKTQDADADLILEAKQFHLDLTKPHSVVAIRCQPGEVRYLNNDLSNLTFILDKKTSLIIVEDELVLRRLEKQLQSKLVHFGISDLTMQLGAGVDHAVTTLEISERFSDQSLNHYQKIFFIDYLLKSHLPVQSIVEKFQRLAKTDSGKEIIITIKEFIHCNLNVNQTAKNLYSHRNTVNYRLKKVKTTFQLDPKKTTDLFQLYVGYLYFVDQQ